MSTTIENKPVVHAPEALLPPTDWSSTFKERTRVLNNVDATKSKNDKSKSSKSSKSSSKCVVYWMQRDVRTSDNWALSYASYLAKERQIPLLVVYALQPPPPPSESERDDDADQEFVPPDLVNLRMTARYAQFTLGGLERVHDELKAKGIPLHVVCPQSHDGVGEAVCRSILGSGNSAAEVVVCDFSPLRHFRQWMELQAAPLLEEASVPFVQVDAHNIVPVWSAADKRQVGARTLRPRIHKVVNEYLKEHAPEIDSNPNDGTPLPEFERGEYERYLNVDESVPAVDWAKPGTDAGMDQMRSFFQRGLKKYDTSRNDPNEKGICSDLSPWINHGHVSFQRVVSETKKLNKYANGTAAFIEEGVVRRELSDNYCYYTPNDYDALTAGAGWAQETLQVHANDEREYQYTLEEFERGRTHDDLWNAAQLQVVREGRMHGFLRMYWAKKVLEWTESPEAALHTAQYLNDKYALDGRDPNGFVGVAWSVVGVHDMGWKEREIFGKIRYMNYAGCKRKFKVPTFVAKYQGASENAAKAAAAKKKKEKEDGQKKRQRQSTTGSSSKKKKKSSKVTK